MLLYLVLYFDHWNQRFGQFHQTNNQTQVCICVITESIFLTKFSHFLPQQFNSVVKETESQQNVQTNGVGRKKSRVPSIRVPSVTAIAETGDTPMTRSQSVGHGMRTSQYHDKTDDVRYMLSQPLLTNTGREIKPLSESRRRSSGTLSRPDIFYQVQNT